MSKKQWVLPNRQNFLEWTYDKFHPDKYKVDQAHKGIKIMPQQRFTTDFINNSSPYRGLILYHGLGVGKTFNSIRVAEDFINKNKKVIVLLPASLATNYKEEIMKYASIGSPQKKIWSFIDFSDLKDEIKEEICSQLFLNYKFAKKLDFKLWYPYIKNYPDVVGNVNILKDDIKWSSLDDDQKELCKKTIENIIENRYTIVNYNGLNRKSIKLYDSKFFSNSFVVIDEAHNFISRVVNDREIAKELYKNMMFAYNLKLLLLTGTPVINHPFELAIAINLVRGTIKEYEFSVQNVKKDDVINKLKQNDLFKYIDYLDVKEGKNKVLLTLVPDRFVLNNNNMLIRNTKKITNFEILESISKIINTKTYKTNIRLALPKSKAEFESLFLDTTDPDNPFVKNADLFMRRIIGTVSYFKSADEKLFPSVSEKHITHVDMSDYQFGKYVLERDKERKMEQNMKKSGIIQGNVMSNNNNVYRAFSRMICNFVFPEKIKRPFPRDLKKLKNEIDTVGIDEEDQDISNPQPPSNDFKKGYEYLINKAMNTLNTNKDNYLTLDILKANYSPKMALIFERIQNSPKTLLYSQFRNVEGLGVMQLILENAGWKRVVIGSDIDPEIFDPKYDNKRYIVFDNDRDKNKILLQLYNGYFDMLPTNLQSQLEPLIDEQKRKNLRGELINLIMITQSGAEGISLKNVRRVLIMEPFWNMVRMDQVIGRAVRTNSHKDLPPNEQNVDVYIFTSVFTKEQLDNNFTLKTLDDGLSSDMHILNIAQKKDNIIQTFLNYLKASAVDCRIHSSLNKLMKQNPPLQCYSFPIALNGAKYKEEYSYIPDINNDTQNISKLERRRKIIGKVVLYKNKKYVIVDNDNILYDYDLYKEAGVLKIVHKLSSKVVKQVLPPKQPSPKAPSPPKELSPKAPSPPKEPSPKAPSPPKINQKIVELLKVTEKNLRSTTKGTYDPKKEYKRLKPIIDQYLKGPIDVGGGGDCQFRSLAKWITNDEEDHLQVRNDICKYIDENKYRFESFELSSNSDDIEIKVDKDICNKPGKWGNNMSLAAASEYYNARIILTHKTGKTYSIEYIENDDDLADIPDKIFWLFYYDQIHYQTYTLK